MADTTDPQLIETVKSFLRRVDPKQLTTAEEIGAYERFKNLYFSLTRDECRKQGLNPWEADEVESQIISKLPTFLLRFRHYGRKGSFRKWWRRLARYQISSHRRRQLRRRRREALADQRALKEAVGREISVWEQVDRRLLKELVASLLEKMSMSKTSKMRYYGELLDRRLLQDQSIAELAEYFKKSKASISQDVGRAKKAFFDRFGNRFDEPNPST